jgi:hypothetical protein
MLRFEARGLRVNSSMQLGNILDLYNLSIMQNIPNRPQFYSKKDFRFYELCIHQWLSSNLEVKRAKCLIASQFARTGISFCRNPLRSQSSFSLTLSVSTSVRPKVVSAECSIRATETESQNSFFSKILNCSTFSLVWNVLSYTSQSC